MTDTRSSADTGYTNWVLHRQPDDQIIDHRFSIWSNGDPVVLANEMPGEEGVLAYIVDVLNRTPAQAPLATFVAELASKQQPLGAEFAKVLAEVPYATFDEPQPRSSAGIASAVCCYCDAPLSCAACGREQPDNNGEPQAPSTLIEKAAKIIHPGAFDKEDGSTFQRHEAKMKAKRVIDLALSRPDRGDAE